MEARTLAVGGIEMRWYEQGEGTPVVLIHGIPTSPHLWRYVRRELHGMRALAWELVGYGDSIPAGRDRDLSVARQAEYLDRWMAALAIPRAVLVGHDLGCGIAQIAAVRHRARCAGLVLTDGIAYDNWPVPPVKALQLTAPVSALLPKPIARRLFRGLFRMLHDQRAMADESFPIHWAPYERHDGARALIRQVRALDVHDTLAIAADLPRLAGLPARIVWSTADRFLPLRYGERLARDLGAPLVTIAGGHHYTPEDHPTVIASAIHDVVDIVRAREQQTASLTPLQ